MITASIVLYNTKDDDLQNVLSCVINKVDYLYLIDNSPIKKYKSLFSNNQKIIYIEHHNTGYGSSHNVALIEAVKLHSKYHFILNPDISFSESIINEILNFMDDDNEVISLMPNVLNLDGTNQFLAKKLPSPYIMFMRRFFTDSFFFKKMNSDYELHHSGYNKILNVPCLSGCFMVLRVSSVEEFELYFDDRFFMYFEDYDLIRRCHKKGKTIFYPLVSITHNHARQAHTSLKMLFIFGLSAIKYFNKYGWFFDNERKVMNRAIDLEIESYDRKS